MPTPVTPDREHFVFVYGTLADADRLSMLLAPRVYTDPMPAAVLPGYRRERCAFYYAVPDHEAAIEGVLIGPFSDAELAQLDRYEGCPLLYTRQQATAVAPDGTGTASVWVYVGARLRENHEAHLEGRGLSGCSR